MTRRLIVSVPKPLTASARSRMADEIAAAEKRPGLPLILDEGATAHYDDDAAPRRWDVLFLLVGWLVFLTAMAASVHPQ